MFPASQERKADAFAELHRGEPFVIPNPWDAGSSAIPVAAGESPSRMLVAEKLLVPVPLRCGESRRCPQNDRLLPDAEAPAESENGTRLALV
jgi:hypothetical protein